MIEDVGQVWVDRRALWTIAHRVTKESDMT